MTVPLREDAPLWKPPPEFLRELPELISGTDPELLKPEARAWLLRDPQAREYAQQICGAIAMFADLPSRMAATTQEPLSHRAKRSVERAAKQLPQRLAEVLWPLLTLELDRVAQASGGRFMVPSLIDGSYQSDSARLFRDRDMLIEHLAKTGRGIGSLSAMKLATGSRAGTSDSTVHAQRLIEGLRVCLPNHSMVRWSRLLLDYFQGACSGLSDWQSFIVASNVTAYYDHVLQTAALVGASSREHVMTIELCDKLLAEYPLSAACAAASYSGMKSSLSVGDMSRSWTYFHRFARAVAKTPNHLVVWREQFLVDASDWRTALNSNAELVRELLTFLGKAS
jgi:hypothetical protein